MYEYKAELVRVVDGDTLDVSLDLGFYIKHQVRLRLLNVDTPEIRTRNKVEKAAGFKAKNFVEQELGNSPNISITTEKRGKYGRYLALVIYTDKQGIIKCLNDELVHKGYAERNT